MTSKNIKHSNEVIKNKCIVSVCLIILMTLTLLAANSLSVHALTEADLTALNPEFMGEALASEFDYSPFSFEADVSGRINRVRAVFEDYHVKQRPWFDQKDTSEHILGFGRLYSQQILLAEPAEEIEKTLHRFPAVEFGASVPMNIYALRELNPELEHYERLPAAVSGDNEMGFYFPPEGAGIALVADTAGDIYAFVRIIPAEEIDEKMGTSTLGEKTAIHPDLGEIYYTDVYVREPGERFDLSLWFGSHKLAETAAQTGDRIEPGFVIEKLELSPGQFMGLMQLDFEVYNDSDRSFRMGLFNITFYNRSAEVVGHAAVPVQEIGEGERASALYPISLDIKTPLEEISYTVEYTSLF